MAVFGKEFLSACLKNARCKMPPNHLKFLFTICLRKEDNKKAGETRYNEAKVYVASSLKLDDTSAQLRARVV